jgi:hypothetical protein
MDLLSILRTLWRFKLATLSVLLLTATAGYYVYAFVPPVYEAKASVLLVNPLPPPTEQQIEKNPALGQFNANNPFLRFGDPNVLSNVVAARLDDDNVRDELERQGADPRYEVVPGNQFGFATPIVQTTARGETQGEAIATAILVDAYVKSELLTLQKVYEADDRYLVSPLQLTSPDQASERVSARLRSVIAVVALGGFLLFTVISACVAVTRRREETAAAAVATPGADLETSAVSQERRRGEDTGTTRRMRPRRQDVVDQNVSTR